MVAVFRYWLQTFLLVQDGFEVHLHLPRQELYFANAQYAIDYVPKLYGMGL